MSWACRYSTADRIDLKRTEKYGSGELLQEETDEKKEGVKETTTNRTTSCEEDSANLPFATIRVNSSPPTASSNEK